MQLELEATRAEYFELYDMAPVGYITLTNDHIIKQVNLAAPMLLGIKRKDLNNRSLSSFIPVDSEEKLYLHYRRLERGKKEPALNFTIRREDGSEIQVQFESNLVKNGNIKGFRTVLTDVTEIKKTKEELRRANIELEKKVSERTKGLVQSQSQLQRTVEELARSNTELMEFAYVASHDLQEPLRMVVSYLTLLESKYHDDLNPTALEYIQYAVSGGKRMRNLIDDLLRYSRLENKEIAFSCVDMNAVIARTVDLLQVSIKESGANIETADLPSVNADESQMVQVMQNLIGNADQFSTARIDRS